jgi:hypothetical protein
MLTEQATNPRLETAAVRVLAMLQKWDERFNCHATPKRSHERKAFQTKLMVIVPESRNALGDVLPRQVIDVWTRNISQGGLAFLTFGRLETLATHLIVKLGEKYMLSRIMRHREVHDGFYEYGVKYVEEVSV